MDNIKIVLTSLNNDGHHCRCQFCNKVIAEYKDEKMAPSAQDCYNTGNVPIPNFGWFCSQDCAAYYEKKHDIKFARTAEGKVDYYINGL